MAFQNSPAAGRGGLWTIPATGVFTTLPLISLSPWLCSQVSDWHTQATPADILRLAHFRSIISKNTYIMIGTAWVLQSHPFSTGTARGPVGFHTLDLLSHEAVSSDLMSQLVWCVCQSSAHFQDDGRNTGADDLPKIRDKVRLRCLLCLETTVGQRFSKYFACISSAAVLTAGVKLLGTEGWHLCCLPCLGFSQHGHHTCS